jgi:hypothetical protein
LTVKKLRFGSIKELKMETRRLAEMEISIYEKVEMEIDTTIATLYEETAGTSLKDGLNRFVRAYPSVGGNSFIPHT